MIRPTDPNYRATVDAIFANAKEPADVFLGVIQRLAGRERVNGIIDVGTGATGVVAKHIWEEIAIDKHALDAHVIRDMPTDWELHVPMNMLEMLATFGAKRFDVVQSCDVIEHLKHADGERWLGEMTTVARVAVLIFCPCGFWENTVGHERYPDNPFQEHKSGWTEEDFRALGFDAHAWGKDYLIAWKVVED